MAFWESSKKGKRKEDIEEVKKQVEGRKTRLPEPPKPPTLTPERETDTEEPTVQMEKPEPRGPEPPEKPQQPQQPQQAQRSELPTTKGPITGRRQPDVGGDNFTPLFVKIDKYRQILQNLEEIKNTLKDLRDLFALMSEVDEIKREGMKSLREGISGLTDTLISMDEKFIRPEGSEDFIDEPRSRVSGNVRNLKDELQDIKREFSRLR